MSKGNKSKTCDNKDDITRFIYDMSTAFKIMKALYTYDTLYINNMESKTAEDGKNDGLTNLDIPVLARINGPNTFKLLVPRAIAHMFNIQKEDLVVYQIVDVIKKDSLKYVAKSYR